MRQGDAVGNWETFGFYVPVNTIQSDEWAVPRNAAVQIIAAITANANRKKYPAGMVECSRYAANRTD